jgi:hypothetical protein
VNRRQPVNNRVTGGRARVRQEVSVSQIFAAVIKVQKILGSAIIPLPFIPLPFSDCLACGSVGPDEKLTSAVIMGRV